MVNIDRKLTELLADRIYGIDLGASNSCIAYVDELSGEPVVVTNSDDLYLTPSVVLFCPDGSISVGQRAKNALSLQWERGNVTFKREMGTKQCFTVDGKKYLPEHIASFILQNLVLDATARLTNHAKLKHPIKRVVITVPAYFGFPEREATKAAGEMAGLEVVEILNEPTAVVLSNRAGQPLAEELVLIYDLAGATFDVSLIECSGSIIKEVKIGGSSRLGGDDWDQALGALVIDKFIKIRPVKAHAQQDEMFLRRLLLDVERLKKQLSSEVLAQMLVTYEDSFANVEVSRSEFEELTSHLLEQTMNIVREVVKDDKHCCSYRPNKVLLVGASSKMPYVSARLKQVLQEELGVEVSVELRDPDLSVAKGAAFRGFIIGLQEILGARLSNENEVLSAYPYLRDHYKRPNVSYYLTRSLGVLAVDSKDPSEKASAVFHVLHAMERPFHKRTETFYTLVPNQRMVKLQIFEQGGESESDDPEHNVKVAEVEIDALGAWNLPKGAPIECSLMLEDDWIVFGSVKEPTSGRSKEIKFSIYGDLRDKRWEEGGLGVEEPNVSHE
jgi:molecular chaperone DnaK